MGTKRITFRWLAVVAVVSQIALAVPPASLAGYGEAPEGALQDTLPAHRYHGGDRAPAQQVDSCDCDCLTHLTCTMPTPLLSTGADANDPAPPGAERSQARTQPTLAAHDRRLERPPA
ncbi:MAG: hypothetical protein CMN57_08155 [Gammaproteobacteria bacterium]|jgi:hypothetical protein|nr:hypothetical protein [Gammaproteobacteria bacterium]|tara:strand:- start:26 stop:379 length:354 start_codon:yes stop_codon:yes gene_type:complete